MRTVTAPTALQPLSRFSAGIAIGALIVACCFKVASADAAPAAGADVTATAARPTDAGPTTDSTCTKSDLAPRRASRSAPGCHQH